jgi:sulfur relay (sulfurtransferase) DsrC/TusE family protein
MGIEVNGTTYETDEEGYLLNLSDWNEDIANVIAKGENVEMTAQPLGSGQLPA